MKKNFEKIINDAVKKYKHYHRQIKKFKLSSIKEDFVITEQEEREGGYYGSYNLKTLTT